MVFHRAELNYRTRGGGDMVNITGDVDEVITTRGMREGIGVVTVVGSTAAVTTIEYEPNLVKDFAELMERLAPSDKRYHHHETWGDDNGHAHLRASLVGPAVSLVISGGRMIRGRWQQLVLIDFDTRPRQRTVIIGLYGEI